MNNPINTTPPHQTPTNRPNENNTTYDPPTLPPTPSSQQAPTSTTTHLENDNTEIPTDTKKYNLTKRREFHRKQRARSADVNPDYMSPTNKDQEHRDQPSAPVTPAATHSGRGRQAPSDDESDSSNDDLEHETSEEDKSTTKRDTEEQPDVAGTGPMSDGAKINGDDHNESERDNDTNNTSDEEFPWNDSESDEERNDMEMALSTTSNKTTDTTPTPTTGDDMDIENENIISTLTEAEIAERL
jgi:hypothetical protein